MKNAAKDAAVLYVEDDPTDVMFMRLGFANAGLTVPLHVVDDGQQAIDYLAGAGPYANRAIYPMPGLVLLDLNLTGVSGLDVLRWVCTQPHLQELPVVVLSASTRPDDRFQVQHLGASGYLVKPADMNTLPRLLKPLLAFWLG